MNAVRGISDIIVTPGLINVDFADVVHIMQSRGLALMGTGIASGQNRAREAAQKAINSPLLEDIRIEGATGLLVNITGGPTTSLREVNEALSMIQDAVHEDTDTIFGAVIDERMGDELKITVVATGYTRVEPSFDDDREKVRTRFGTGKTPAVPQPPAAPPAPPPHVEPPPMVQQYADADYDELEQVPVYAGDSTVYAQQYAQTDMQARSYEFGQYNDPPALPQTHREIVAQAAHAQSTARPLTAPTGAIETDSARRSRALLDNLQEPPALRASMPRDTGKRQPVRSNPFTEEAGLENLDIPTFLRPPK